jgi:hypothetical protein
MRIYKILISLPLILSALSSEPVQCREEKELEVPSPRNNHLAVLFIRNCGAAADVVSHVNLFPGDRSIERSHQGIITDGEVFVVKGTADIEMTWKNRSALSIRCVNCSTLKVISAQDRWNDVQILYELK